MNVTWWEWVFHPSGKVGDTYVQSHTDMIAYQEAIEHDQLPAKRGLMISRDDEIRQKVINELICHFQLSPMKIEQQFDIDFRDYFSDELAALKSMEKDGLLHIDHKMMTINPAGRLLIRNVCMVFDQYFQSKSNQALYSKVI